MSEDALELRVLGMVAGGTTTVPAVAAALGVEESTVTAAVDRATQQGLLSEQDDMLALTAQGQAALAVDLGSAREKPPEVPWDKVELSFRRARHVRRVMLLLALVVLVVGFLYELR